MINKLSNQSYIFNELLNFWKIPINIGIDFISFSGSGFIDLVGKSKQLGLTIAFYNSEDNSGSLTRFKLIYGDILKNTIIDKGFFRNDNHLILPASSILKNSFKQIGIESKKILLSTKIKNQIIPLIIQPSDGLIIFLFDVENLLKNYLLGRINNSKSFLFKLLPFNYRKFPRIFKRIFLFLFSALLLNLEMKIFKQKTLLTWPECYDLENLRIIFISILKILKKDHIPYLDFWPNGAKSCISLSFDFDSPSSFKNFNRFKKQDNLIFLESTCFLLSDQKNIDFSKEFARKNSLQGLKIGSHGYSHDGKISFIRNSKLDNRIKSIKELFETRFGFRTPQLLFNEEFIRKISSYLIFDSSISNSMLDISGIRGSGTIFPYYIQDTNNILEIPLTLPMEYEFKIQKMTPLEGFQTYKQKIHEIMAYEGIINVTFHPEVDLSANNNWISLYHKFLDYITNLKSENTYITSLEEIKCIWDYRRNLFLLLENNKVKICTKNKELNNNRKEFDFQINYWW